MLTWAATLLFGAVVGFSLGLTGGGGAIFAVPLLVYGLGLAPRQAVGVSLLTVGITAWAGFLARARRGQVELATGLLFAFAGALGAPVGSWLAERLPEAWLMTLFAVLMVIIAARLWRQSSMRREDAGADTGTRACRRDERGALSLTTRCAARLLLVGVLTGFITGLFGVGGGFVIVPALVLFSRMPIHLAVGTSLMVIALVSVSGMASFFWMGRTLPVELTGLFCMGALGGLWGGQGLAQRLSGPVLQRTFAVAILLVAGFILLRSAFPG